MLATYVPFLNFALVASITPGPNNTMLAASGANFGFRRTLSHLLGVQVGFASLVLLTTFGLGLVFESYPLFQQILSYVGGAFILYLAYRIATASGFGGKRRGAPLRFIEAAGFQYLNPKAWVMSIAAASTYMQGVYSYGVEAMILTAGFFVVGSFSSAVWVVFGVGIARFLDRPWKLRLFNVIMALSLIASVFQVLL